MVGGVYKMFRDVSIHACARECVPNEHVKRECIKIHKQIILYSIDCFAKNKSNLVIIKLYMSIVNRYPKFIVKITVGGNNFNL